MSPSIAVMVMNVRSVNVKGFIIRSVDAVLNLTLGRFLQILLALLVLAVGPSLLTYAQQQGRQDTQPSLPTVKESERGLSQQSSPGQQVKRFHVTVTIADPSELRVREKQFVKVGQVLVSRDLSLARLRMKREDLQRQLEDARRQVPQLPKADYSALDAQLKSALDEVEVAKKAVNDQRDRIAVLEAQELPSDIKQDVLEHEQRYLGKLQADLDRALSQVEYVKALRLSAQNDYAYRVYRHSLDVAQYKSSLLELQARLARVDEEISNAKTITSPFDGVVSRVSISRFDDRFRVELDLRRRG